MDFKVKYLTVSRLREGYRFRAFSKNLTNRLIHVSIPIEEPVRIVRANLTINAKQGMIDRMAGHIWEAWRKENHDDAKERWREWRRNLTISFFLSLSQDHRDYRRCGDRRKSWAWWGGHAPVLKKGTRPRSEIPTSDNSRLDNRGREGWKSIFFGRTSSVYSSRIWAWFTRISNDNDDDDDLIGRDSRCTVDELEQRRQNADRVARAVNG